MKIELDGQYSDGLNALDGFGHVVVLWWAHKYVEYRNQIDMVIDLPYAPGTKAGLFATRSPVRPNPVCVSTAEIREISIKKAIGKLEAPSNLTNIVKQKGFDQLPITLEHGEGIGELPDIHNDPFDRILVVQAQKENLIIVTNDRIIPKYKVNTLATIL